MLPNHSNSAGLERARHAQEARRNLAGKTVSHSSGSRTDEEDEESSAEVEELMEAAPPDSPDVNRLSARGRSGSCASDMFRILPSTTTAATAYRMDASGSANQLEPVAITHRAASPVSSLFGEARLCHPADNDTLQAQSESQASSRSPTPNSDQEEALLPPAYFESPIFATPETVRPGTYLSEATSSLARLSANLSPQAPGNKRGFFANLFSPNPRSSPSSPSNFRNSSPAMAAVQQTSQHNRTQSSPLPSPSADNFPTSSAMRRSGTLTGPTGSGLGLGLQVDGSLDAMSSRAGGFLRNSASFLRFSQGQADDNNARLEDIGVKLDAITNTMSLSRNGQPTCGIVLDDKYLLIGTTSGLDFLPLDVPDQRKPVPLIKRTRFKQLAILKERSNILLAVAGRNDHVRVYALDGIRAIIERKMKEINAPSLARVLVNVASGYSPIPSATGDAFPIPRLPAENVRRSASGRAAPPPPLDLVASREQPPIISPPPDYPITPRRPSTHRSASTMVGGRTIRSRNHSIVSSLPTDLSNNDIRRHGSRESLRLASRRGSAVTIVASRHNRNAAAANVASRRSNDNVTAEAPAEEDDWERVDRAEINAQIHIETSDIPAASSSPSASEDDDLPPLPKTPISPRSLRMKARSASVESNSAFNQELTDFLQNPTAPALKRSISSQSRLMARSASRDEDGSTRDLAAFLRDSHPPSMPSSASLPSSNNDDEEILGADRLPHSSTCDSLASVTTTHLAPDVVVSDSMPSPSLRSSLMPRSASSQSGSTRALADFLRQDTVPREVQSNNMLRSDSSGSWTTVPNTPAIRQRAQFSDDQHFAASPRDMSEVNVRQRKRWSMFDGFTSPSNSPEQGLRPATPEQMVEHAAISGAEAASIATISSTQAQDSMRSDRSLRQESSDDKPDRGYRISETDSTIDSGIDLSNGSATIVAEKHPASAAAPLDFVKLARSKGARMIRAVETKNKTYLAVLCGDAGERIELFTGARNVSLSLNRTFVLPESPRTIEFQMQGDELVDIYLMYDESIFALEPSTVRVREVGILRNERRNARREREREQSAQTRNRAGPTSAAVREEHDVPAPNTDFTGVGNESPARQSSDLEASDLAAATVPEAPVWQLPKQSLAPFTTFQQLFFIPPVPSSVLAPAYVIPPTYDAVVESSPMPPQGPHLAPPPEIAASAPLLSPISLLANHPARHSGPPGLFFVTRGRGATNIVDGDGRSVIKKALVWEDPDEDPLLLGTPEAFRHLRHINRLEVMLTDCARKTVLVAISSSDIQAIEIGLSVRGVEVCPDGIAKRRKKAQSLPQWDNMRDVVFLGSSGSRVFWAERVSNHVTIHRLSSSI